MKISFVTGICIKNDAISNAIIDEIMALREDKANQVLLFAYKCEPLDLPFHQACSVADVSLHQHFQASDLIIFHFGIYYPLFDLLAIVPPKAKSLVVFHNITPKALVSESLHETIDKSFAQLTNILWANHVLADSHTNLKILRGRGIYTRATVLPLAVKTNEEIPGTKPSFDDEIVRIAFVGRLVPSKGPHDLLEAVGASLAKLPGVQLELSMIGNLKLSDSSMIEQVKSAGEGLVQKFDGRFSFRLHGDASDERKNRTLAKADLFVLPTYHEGFCVPILEAMAHGCRVITYENSNTPAVSGGLSDLLPTGDISKLSQSITQTVNDVRSSNWRKKGYVAYFGKVNKYTSHFSPKLVKSRFKKFIDDWMRNGFILHKYLADHCGELVIAPCKNVVEISSESLLERPDYYRRLPRRILLGESEPCIGEGWHLPEDWPPKLRNFSNAGTLYLSVPDSWPARLTIKAFCGYEKVAQDPITLSVSAEGVHLTSHTFTSHSWAVLSVNLPEDFSNKPFLAIHLSTDKTWVPDDFYNNGDLRELGIAVRSVGIDCESSAN